MEIEALAQTTGASTAQPMDFSIARMMGFAKRSALQGSFKAQFALKEIATFFSKLLVWLRAGLGDI